MLNSSSSLWIICPLLMYLLLHILLMYLLFMLSLTVCRWEVKEADNCTTDPGGKVILLKAQEALAANERRTDAQHGISASVLFRKLLILWVLHKSALWPGWSTLKMWVEEEYALSLEREVTSLGSYWFVKQRCYMDVFFHNRMWQMEPDKE